MDSISKKPKKLKYQEYLCKFPNCPTEEFEEVNREAYRWVHKPMLENDFLPLNLIKDPPPRMLEKEDLMCIAYGLSLFDTLNGAKKSYHTNYEKRKTSLKQFFIDEKGNCIAHVKLTVDSGIANEPSPNNFGHYTLHEYDDFDFKSVTNNIFNIFETNGDIIYQK